VCSHNEAHRYDFEHHLHRIDDQENEIDSITVLCDAVDLFVNGKEEAIYNNNNQNKSIEPRIDCDNLDHPVSEWIRHGETTQRYGGIIFLICILATDIDICSWVSREGVTHIFHLLVAKLSEGETSDVLNFSHLLLEPLSIEFFSFLWI
jgi:hypothetical protein